jgi:CheY-like chemotaxis protein
MRDQLSLPPVAILLVEAEPAESTLRREAFTAGPPPVRGHIVPEVDEALAFFRHAGTYGPALRSRLEVTSLKLPRKPGFDRIAGSKGDPALRPIPIIVFTAYDSPGIVRQSDTLEANSDRMKPFARDACFATGQKR